MQSPNRSRGGNGTYLERDLINSPAFRCLTKTAMIVYLDFCLRKQIHKKSKHGKVEILNNGELVYTYAEAERVGISKPAFQRAIDQLIERGLIYLASTGAGLYRSANLYGISEQWKNWGTASFRAKPRPRRKSQYPNAGFKPGHRYYPPGGATQES